MRKNLLALSIAAMVGGLSGAANAAVEVDTTGTGGGRLISNAAPFGGLVLPGTAGSATTAPAANQLTPTSTGVGHILFVPYFTTQAGNMTLLNLVNTDTTNGKAVKLRFRGAANSDDLFDITVYLSPGDVWAANVSANGDLSALSTLDTSCTLPSAAQIKDETQGKFVTSRVLNNDPKETREGYVEILNMADVVPGSALFNATKHVNGVVSCNQAVMDLQALPLVNDAASANSPVARGYSWPTGGLMANWTIVNVGTKASFSGEAVALRATPTGQIDVPGAANLVFSPQNGIAVPGNQVQVLTADPLLKTGAVRAANYDFPDLSTPYTTASGAGAPETQANDLARVLATQSINNEYLTNPAVSFTTDWVFSMPTRRYAVALNYETKAIVGHGVGTYVAEYAANIASNYFSADQRLGNASLNKTKDRICVDAGTLQAFDTEEQSKTTFVISPGDTLKFCGETSVLSFNGKPSVLGAAIAAQNIPTGFTDGWLRINTNGLNNNGIPVMGYAVGKAIGPDAGNFGGTWMHRTNRFAGQPF